MEKLSLRSDGIAETPSGLFAVIPRHKSGETDDTAWFAFKPGMLSEAIRIEWPKQASIVIIPSDIAVTMLRMGYAYNLTAEVVAAYNSAVDELLKEAAPPAPQQTGEP